MGLSGFHTHQLKKLVKGNLGIIKCIELVFNYLWDRGTELELFVTTSYDIYWESMKKLLSTCYAFYV
jgi:hypothetical protein